MTRSAEAQLEIPVKIPEFLPVLPVQDAVVFPYVISPQSVHRETSVAAVDHALSGDRIVLLVAQRDPEEPSPAPDSLYEVGTAAVIMRMLKLPDGRIRILVQGLARARIEHFSQTDPFLQAHVRHLEDLPPETDGLEVEALKRTVKDALERIANLGQPVSTEVLLLAATMEDTGRLADLVTSNLELNLPQAQSILETLPPIDRLRQVHRLLTRETELLGMQQEISLQARGEMDRTQREYYLRQQLKAIHQELGDADELAAEIASYRQVAKEKEISGEAADELDKQLNRLERSHPEGAETPLIRTYLDWLTGLPWNRCSRDRLGAGSSSADPRRRSSRTAADQGADPGASRRAPVESGLTRSPTLPGRPTGRRQDLPGAIDRPRHGTAVRPPLPGRRPRRGGDPGTPPDLRRGASGTDHPGIEPGRHQQSGVHAR